MTIGWRFTTFSIALLVAGALGGCGDDAPARLPSAPAAPVPGASPAPPSVTRITLNGPTTVHIDEVAEFTVVAHLSDGSTRDATSEVSWQTNANILSMVAPGRFTGRQKGETSLLANLSGRSTVIGTIIVVPRGTYRLSGVVTDESVNLTGASVVIEDAALGRTSLVTIGGSYKVFGVAGPTRITVSKSGYQTVTRDQTIESHQTVNVDLPLLRPRDDVSGSYTVTFTAAPECSSLPEDARVRTYAATITQTGPRLEVRLEGGRFFSTGGRTLNRFGGTLEPLFARFDLTPTWYDYYHYFYTFPDIFEELQPQVYFSVEGGMTAPVTPAGISGVFSGSIGVHGGSPRFLAIARCVSANHRMALTR